MTIVYIILLILVLVVIILAYFNHKRKQIAYKLIENYLIKTYGLVIKGDKSYDFFIPSINQIVKVLFLNKTDELVINSKTMWQINYNMSIKNCPNKSKIILAMKDFMLKEENKLVIIYKDCYSIKKYINECEMVFVDKSTNCYNAKVVKYNELDY